MTEFTSLPPLYYDWIYKLPPLYYDWIYKLPPLYFDWIYKLPPLYYDWIYKLPPLYYDSHFNWIKVVTESCLVDHYSSNITVLIKYELHQ
jgi:hypothetical protein